MSDLIIYGAGGLGREVRDLVLSLSQYRLIGYCDDSVETGKLADGVPVLGGISYLHELSARQSSDINIVVAIGSPLHKRNLVNRLSQIERITFPALVSPFAIVQSQSVQIGPGSIICAGCILTTDIKIGNHVLINLNCTVGHDTIIKDFSAVMPGVNIAGNVHVGEQCLIGMGANIINNVTVGHRVVVGAGSVLIRNVQDDVTAAGVPAKIIRYGSK